MSRVRVSASLLAVSSVFAALWMWIAQDNAGVVVVLLILAAAFLAVVAPFDAPDPARRTRVVIACVAYVAAVGVAIALAHATNGSGLLISVLSLLLEVGIAITCWGLATRNRRRAPKSQRYYDN